MIEKSLRLLALGATLVAGPAFAADPVPKSAPASVAAPKQQKLIRVATLPNIQANQEFQANVQLVQTQRQQAIELNAAIEKETNAAKKKELKTKLDELMAKLNENHQKMVKLYNFSLERNYTLVTEVSHVYMFVSDEEAAKYEKDQAAEAAAKEAAAKKKK
jgi:hypothetical protein